MSNIQREKGKIHFRINANDPGTIRKGIIVIVLSILIIFLLILYSLTLRTPVFMFIVLIGGIFLIYACFFIITFGVFARYRLTFDRDSRSVSVFDFKDNVKLWQEDFNPEFLHFSKTRQHVGYISRLCYVLVYGRKQQDLIEDSEPTPDRSLLCIGSEHRLKMLKDEIIELFR